MAKTASRIQIENARFAEQNNFTAYVTEESHFHDRTVVHRRDSLACARVADERASAPLLPPPQTVLFAPQVGHYLCWINCPVSNCLPWASLSHPLVLCVSNRFTKAASPFSAACRCQARRYKGAAQRGVAKAFETHNTRRGRVPSPQVRRC